MTGLSLRDGITVLAHATPHPDIGWHSNNWISEPVRSEVGAAMRWTASELVSLVHGIEQLDADILGWERGGVGQSLWSIMAMDPDIARTLRTAVRLATEDLKLETAVRLLVCYQWVADEPLSAVLEILAEVPRLNGHELVNMILDDLREFGRIDVY